MKAHETILAYAKGYGDHVYNRQYLPYSADYINKWHRNVDEHGRRYMTRSRGNGVIVRQYLDESPGVPLSSVWTDIPSLNGAAGWFPKKHDERTGYPTQKPIALYERIIKASSNEGDMVLDPFAGCATTCVAAERLGRKWIAIDINDEAADVLRDRLAADASRLPEGDSRRDREVRVCTAPPERTDDGAMAAPELTLVVQRPKAPRLTVRELREHLEARDGLRCQGCGWEPPLLEYLEVDHRKPKSHGGVEELHNRILLCGPCNGAKGNKLSLDELRKARAAENRILDTAWYERDGKVW